MSFTICWNQTPNKKQSMLGDELSLPDSSVVFCVPGRLLAKQTNQSQKDEV